jgi:hypothetical protein
MPSPSIIILFSSIFGYASAVPWAVAKETATYTADEWSPRPTNTPLAARDIFKRSSVNVDVCGWIGGNSAQPVGCASGSSCIHDTLGFVGCCPTSSAGASPIPCTDGLYTTCVDKNSAGYSANSFLINNGVLSWLVGPLNNEGTLSNFYTQSGSFKLLPNNLSAKLHAIWLRSFNGRHHSGY